MGADDAADARYKVARVLSKYSLEEEAEELGDLWLGTGDEQYSLRELADRVNVSLLRAAMVEAGLDPLDGEVENAYRLLTDDDVSAGMRTQQRQELERAGVDVDEVLSDFVTHQAVHTYLTKGRGLEKPAGDDRRQRERDFETLRRLQSRTGVVTESTLERLRDTGRVTLGEFDVFVSVSVFCRDCGTQRTLDELVETEGCECG